jgi:hypothetical protein
MSVCGARLPSLVIIIIAMLTSVPVGAQDLDRGKSGATLFTATCVECHRSPRGLAKNRYSWTLSLYLQQHYTSSAASAQVLTAYLQSVDTPRGNAPQPRQPATSAPAASLRPPAPVPVH